MPMMLIASAVALIPMIVSDIRTREVDLLWLALFGFVQIYFNGTSDILLNVCIVVFMLSGMYLYIIAKYGRKSRITDYFGIGDIIFIFSLTASFSYREFTFFLITGFIFSIVWWLSMPGRKSVPLVSTLGIIYLIWLLIKLL